MAGLARQPECLRSSANDALTQLGKWQPVQPGGPPAHVCYQSQQRLADEKLRQWLQVPPWAQPESDSEHFAAGHHDAESTAAKQGLPAGPHPPAAHDGCRQQPSSPLRWASSSEWSSDVDGPADPHGHQPAELFADGSNTAWY